MGVAPRSAALLRAVHDRPGITRTDAARQVGIGSGAAAEAVAQLVEAGLVAEGPADPTGGRGRPTTVLGPAAQGPLVLAASVTHETWRLQAVGIGGQALADAEHEHAGDASAPVLADIAAAVTRLRRRFGARVRAMAVAAPGTIEGTTLVHATDPSWRGVDLHELWPRAPHFVAGNDATLAATAESARGAAVGAVVALHVRVQAGVGGAVVDGNRVLTGAHGLAGEFGHMPFGDPAVICPCGARGCWGTAVDGGALARLLGRRGPQDPVAFTRRTIARPTPASRAALETVAAALGRGLAGLVNALDPDVVTLGGGGVDLLHAAPAALDAAYRGGLMRERRPAPPPLLAAALGEDGPLIGAAEQAWAAVWAEL